MSLLIIAFRGILNRMQAADSQPVPVLFACHTLGPGGTERQMTEMARHLDRTRFEPHVMAFHPEGFRADELRAAGIPVTGLPVRSLRDHSAVRGAFVLRSYLRRHRIRIVHPFDYPAVTYLAPLARWFGVPVVFGSARGERALFPPFYRRALGWTDRMVDAIVTNSPFCAEELTRDYGVAPNRIRLAPNGVDTERFQPGPRTAPGVLAGASLVIGTVSVLRPEKSIETLIDAFQQLAPRHPEWRLAIAGGGASEDDLRRRAAPLIDAGLCAFLPARSDVAPYYRELDLFVLPSLSEAFSNALLEAMASGVCPIASAAGGNPYILHQDQTGCLFPAGDSQALAGVLERLGTDQTRRLALAAAARQEALSLYSLSAAAGTLGRIYDEALTNTRRAAAS